tara:strand:+ start:175 stop:555 length:381 start_codon:yes stop_codon:yes gene_type:complete
MAGGKHMTKKRGIKRGESLLGGHKRKPIGERGLFKTKFKKGTKIDKVLSGNVKKIKKAGKKIKKTGKKIIKEINPFNKGSAADKAISGNIKKIKDPKGTIKKAGKKLKKAKEQVRKYFNNTYKQGV